MALRRMVRHSVSGRRILNTNGEKEAMTRPIDSINVILLLVNNLPKLCCWPLNRKGGLPRLSIHRGYFRLERILRLWTIRTSETLG
jgi:hypothetical protein